MNVSLLSGRKFVVFILFFTAQNLPAKEWQVIPSLSLEQSITDNVKLENSADKEGDLLSILRPGVLMRRDSNRLNLELNYLLQGILYKNNSDFSKLTNLLNGSLTGELAKERLFLDINARSSEQNINNTGAVAVDNKSISDDVSKVVTYSVSPYWRESVGDIFEAEMRFERNAAESSRSDDSYSNVFTVSLVNGSAFDNLLWKVDFRDQKINYDQSDSSKFQQLSSDVEYVFTPKISFKLRAGIDENTYGSSRENIDGGFWRLGGVVRPSRRTSLEVGAGERFFGTDLLVRMTFRNKRIQSSLNLYRQPETARGVLFEQEILPLTDLFGNPLIDQFTGEQRTLNVSVPTQISEVYIRKRIETAFTYTLRKYSFDMQFYDEDREYELTQRKEDVYGVSANWHYQFNPATKISFNIRFNRNNTSRGNWQEFKVFEYVITRKLTANLSAKFDIRHVDVNSNNRDQKYKQNMISVGLTKEF